MRKRAELRSSPQTGSVVAPDANGQNKVDHRLLRKESGMIEFLAANWLWIVLLVAMLAMHRGGCGMHSHQRHSERAGNDHAHDVAATTQSTRGKLS